MLVLSRKVNQRIALVWPGQEPVYVAVARIDSDKVRLAFAAPPEVRILRTELMDCSSSTPGEPSCPPPP